MAGPNNYEPLRETHRQVEAEQSAPAQNQSPQKQEPAKIGSLEFEEADAARRAEIIERMRAQPNKHNPHEISYMEKRLENDALVNLNAAKQLADKQAGPETARNNAEMTNDRTERAKELANAVEARQQQQEQTLGQTQQKDQSQQR